MSGPLHKDYAGAKLGMWLFLFTELLLFGGLFLLYAAYLARYPREFGTAGGQMHLGFGTLNTVILITSSLLVAMAVTAIQRNARRMVLWLLGGTVLCAAVFLFNKYLEWSDEIGKGIYPNSPKLVAAPPGESVFFSLYYLTVGLHGLHVLIGGTLLTLVAVRVQRGTIHAGDYVLLENGALYWHLVDLVWIFIFPLYYLIL
ncbi:cytochrome c oxidase subunit 3 [Geobacter sp. AOG1]|uniref:cytochrome c oxidase subunit 3 n=1 Tax=Geobacter sp. AOG1 TaxID=1566346 RepID=UPI001CC58F03|nr:cytochrome c oxidase subunit 3 [Geobacter sp. AOG1]GFE56840.1 cytochrome oxidase subunit III [Geobacter sp. AOG1]